MFATLRRPMLASPLLRRSLLLSASLLALALAAPARAQERIVFHPVDDDAVRVDGMLREWRSLPKQSVGSGADASMRFTLGFSGRGIYVAATVRDDRMVREARATGDEDAIVLTLAMPSGRRYRVTEVWLQAGVSGTSAARVLAGSPGRRPEAVEGARIVEASSRGGTGYDLEAFVPWSAVPGSDDWQRGRGAIRLRDVDSEARHAVESEPATAPFDPRNPARLPEIRATGGEQAVLASFLAGHGVPNAEPRFDLRGDVSGDRRPERVVLVERFAVVFGPGYRDGEGYDFMAFGISSASGLRSASLRDLTGDGKAELLVTVRESDGRGSRDVFRVVGFDGQRLSVLFAAETWKETARGSVQNRLDVQRPRRGLPGVRIRAAESEGLDASSYREDPAQDAEPILLPWGPVRERVYRWDGRTFARASEEANPDYVDPAAAAARDRPRTRARPAEPAPLPPSVEQMLVAVRRERNVPRRVPARFHQEANVAGSSTPETLVVLGNALVIVGPAFLDGDSYFFFELPVESAEDVRWLSTADFDGDGRGEILVRVRMHIEDVTRDILMIHRMGESSFDPVLAVEVCRRQGGNLVVNDVEITGRGRRKTLSIGPGRAIGWTEATWPWSGTADEAIDPLLLPWSDRAVRYRWRSGRLVRGR